MTFDKLDGYEFEGLMGNLFRKMGFVVENTSLSNDGGIDIILEYNKPILGGKFFVQCKNWKYPVGEPVIRDMYGLVASERVNKGIIITTSTFTPQAVRFSDNKNLELIDGVKLMQILKDYELTIENTDSSEEKTLLTAEFDDFNKDRYLYIKNKITEDKTDINNYFSQHKYLTSILMANRDNDNLKLIADELLSCDGELLSRFYRMSKKTKKAIESRFSLNYLDANLYLLKGELFKSLELMMDFFKMGSDINLCPKSFDNKTETMSGHFINYGQVMTAYCIIFHRLQYKKGVMYIEQMLKESLSEELAKVKKLEIKNPGFGQDFFKERYRKVKIINSASESVMKSIIKNETNSIYFPLISYDDDAICREGFDYDSPFDAERILKNYDFKKVIAELDRFFDLML